MILAIDAMNIPLSPPRRGSHIGAQGREAHPGNRKRDPGSDVERLRRTNILPEGETQRVRRHRHPGCTSRPWAMLAATIRAKYDPATSLQSPSTLHYKVSTLAAAASAVKDLSERDSGIEPRQLTVCPSPLRQSISRGMALFPGSCLPSGPCNLTEPVHFYSASAEHGCSSNSSPYPVEMRVGGATAWPKRCRSG